MFDRLATQLSVALASWQAFTGAAGFVILWLLGGPWFNWSDTYVLVNNTVTGDVTFLMAFIILADAMRSNAAMHLKIDELIRVTKEARNELIAAENLPSEQITQAAAEMRPK